MEKYRIDTIKDILNLFPTGIIYERKIYSPSIEIDGGRFEICYYFKGNGEEASSYMCCFGNESLSGLRNEVLNFIAKEKIKAIWKKEK